MKNRASGFTLVELTVVIGMLGIMAAIAAPNLSGQLSNMKLKATARDIVSTFQRAKLEAAKENETVVVLFSPAAYLPGGNNGDYEMFVDNGEGGGTAGNLIKDGGETSLLIITMPKEISLISASFTDGTLTKDRLGFNGQGLPKDLYSGNIEVRTSTRWYRINLSVAGNVNMQKSADGINWS